MFSYFIDLRKKFSIEEIYDLFDNEKSSNVDGSDDLPF